MKKNSNRYIKNLVVSAIIAAAYAGLTYLSAFLGLAYGPLQFRVSEVLTLLPMFIGFLFAKYVLKFNLLNNLGAITGGMTSTPALGTLISTAGTENVASAYAATYPAALISVVLVSQFLVILF